MLSRASAAQIASGRDSSITQLSSSQPSSRESVTSNIGRPCAHDGCNRLSLTGGPKCHSHTPKPQVSSPIRGSAQIRSTNSLSPANAEVKTESMPPGRPDTMPPAPAANGLNRRSGESQHPPHPAKSLSHKSLPAKATARKSVAKPGQRRQDSNSAAADEAEIVVASDSTTSIKRAKASKRAHDNVVDSPRKKQRLGLSNATAESEEPKPLFNGATHRVPVKEPGLSTSRPSSQPATATATTTPPVSSGSLAAAQTDDPEEQLRVESRGRETSLPKTHISLDTSLQGRTKEGKVKKKLLRDASVAELSSEKLKAGPTTASDFHPKEGTTEQEKRSDEPPTWEQSPKKRGQGTASSSTVESNKGETHKGHLVMLSLSKPSSGSDAMGSSKPTESSWHSTILAPEPAVKTPCGPLAVNGQIRHKPTAQSQTAYSSHSPFAIRPSPKGIVAKPKEPVPSIIMPKNAGETQNSQSAVIPNPEILQIPERQRMPAPTASKMKPRTEKAKYKTSAGELDRRQVSTTAPWAMSSPAVFALDASSRTDRLNYWATVHETTQPVSRASSFTHKEPPLVQRDVASSAQNQSASSQPIQTQERRSDTKNEHGQHSPVALRQPIHSKHSMHTNEIFSQVLGRTKSGIKAPITVQDGSWGWQGHRSSSAFCQHKEAAFKLQTGYSEHSSTVPQGTKGASLIQTEVTAHPKNSRPADQVRSSTERLELPGTNGVTSTATSDTTGTQLRKERNSSIKAGQPPRNSSMVIDLVSSDSDSPAPSRTIPKTKLPINEAQEARPGLRMHSVTIGPNLTLTRVLPKPGPSANGWGESRRAWEMPWATEEPIPAGPDDKTRFSQKPPTSSEPVATLPGDKTTDSDKPPLSPSRHWTNVTPKRWKALPLCRRIQMLQDQHDESRFDGLIYGPANASNHPQTSSRGMVSVESSPMPQTAPPSNFRHFDPRVHWTHARPKEWHERKQKEIADRGNRKAPQNFGQAAARRARMKTSARPRKVDLPERVEKNPKWMAALAELDNMAKSHHEAQRAKARLRKKRQKAAKDREGDTEMPDAPPETPASTKEAPVIGGMRRPLLEMMMRGRWRERRVGE